MSERAAASEPRERSGAPGVPASERVGGSGGAKPPGLKIDIVTIFPKMVTGPLAEGIVARAIARGLIDVRVHDLRDFTTDRHRVVDDMPFGGGPGMVLKPEPLFGAVEAISAKRDAETASRRSLGEGGRAIVLTSPDGEKLTHAV